MEQNVDIIEDPQQLVWNVIYNTDWSEWWLVTLVSLHVLICCSVIICHRASWHLVSTVTFLSLLTLMYFAQTINTLAAEHHTKFSKEQYFDSNGLFISLILSLPCAINCILFVISWLIQSWSLMVDIKIKQAKFAAGQKKEE